jgi:antitoxin component YwqK of YwqJK toxin-antitoxin module
MNTDVQASRNTNTLLGMLDQSSLFQLLVRLHYPDLINLCKSRNYLYKITCTEWFIDSWKKYNVWTKSIKPASRHIIFREVDRLGVKHGLTQKYREGTMSDVLNELIENTIYHQGIIQSSNIYSPVLQSYTYTYIDDIQYINIVSYNTFCTIYDLYKNKWRCGLQKIYYEDGVIIWDEHNGSGLGLWHGRHGVYIKWWPHGGLKKMGTYKYGKKNGIFHKWSVDGQKEYQRTYINDVIVIN